MTQYRPMINTEAIVLVHFRGDTNQQRIPTPPQAINRLTHRLSLLQEVLVNQVPQATRMINLEAHSGFVDHISHLMKGNMRPITWLHISDIHLRSDRQWSQDVVLKAMCKNVEEQRAAGNELDFVLMTGDTAFSGKTEEYKLAERFFEDFQIASKVPKERIFCVAGNHDIDRTRQSMCFRGTRAELRDPNQVDILLEGGENLETLLMRQENYRHFQRSYFTGQDRTETADGLGYVSRLKIKEIDLAIVGLDSAWLAEGGSDDHGKLLIGERQVINAINLVRQENDPPNIIVGMAHHPLHLLQDFDRHPVQNRIEEIFHFFHCGHLHEPEAHTVGPRGSGCLTLAAGASFETRQSRNAYYVVKLDLLRGVRNVESFQYSPTNGTFSRTSSKDYQIEVIPTQICSVGELAMAMQTYCPSLAPWAHYLSALVLNHKSEFLIPVHNSYIFASFDAFQGIEYSDLKHKTAEFMRFRNVLHILYNREPLSEILVQHGDSIKQYGEALTVACETDSALRERIEAYDRDSQLLTSEPQEAFSHTLDLLDELASAQEWSDLREQAERYLGFANLTVSSQAKRMLALALANSDESTDKEKAIQYYQSLAESETVVFTDLGSLAILLADARCTDKAKGVVLNGIKKFPAKAAYFSEIGQKIVEATGDRNFREQINDAIREKI
ncbi:MAG: metallophosphoesterase [Candidatus Poribacteria bacterium]|nr:metallophosphoesterase [Candidatus Poribacteria bacterium]